MHLRIHSALDKATQFVAMHPQSIRIVGNTLCGLGMILLDQPTIAKDYFRSAYRAIEEDESDDAH